MSAKRKSGDDAFDALDRLVDRELEMLLGRRPSRRPARGLSEPVEKARAPRAEARKTTEPGETDNVVRAHPLARKPKSARKDMGGLFSPEEEAFLSNAADWLEGRENADILLNALCRRLEGDGEDSWEDFTRPPEAADDPVAEDWDSQFEEEDEAEEIWQAASEDEDWGDDGIDLPEDPEAPADDPDDDAVR